MKILLLIAYGAIIALLTCAPDPLLKWEKDETARHEQFRQHILERKQAKEKERLLKEKRDSLPGIDGRVFEFP